MTDGAPKRRLTAVSEDMEKCCYPYPNGSQILALDRAPVPPKRCIENFVENFGAGAPGTLQHAERMVRALDPVHGESVRQPCDDAVHEIAATEAIARSVDAQDWHGDPFQMRVAQLLDGPGGMKRVRKQQ